MTQKITDILKFFLFYISKVIQSNFELAYHIVSPRLKMKPGIIKIPVNLTNNQAILLLVNSISMTPGTLTLDLSEDNKNIYVHFLFLTNEKKRIEEIKKLEMRISKLFK
jgi:multicomponent Na+:H+ antiporter subunit E